MAAPMAEARIVFAFPQSLSVILPDLAEAANAIVGADLAIITGFVVARLLARFAPASEPAEA